MTEVKRAGDSTFKCKCGKSFKLADSLRRHAKRCDGELTEPDSKESGEELMNENDPDASEFMNVDDRNVPADCFGALISYKKC